MKNVIRCYICGQFIKLKNAKLDFTPDSDSSTEEILFSHKKCHKPKQRKYSEKFINKEIAKIDNLNEKLQDNFPMLPETLSEERYSFLIKGIKEWGKHKSDLSYVKGFWYGWCLRGGA